MTESEKVEAQLREFDTYTLEEVQSHNAIYEALRMNGYDVEFFPADFDDDGDAESGPLPGNYSPAFFEFKSDAECVYVVRGKIEHREPRDIELEKFFEEQEQKQCW